VTKHSFLAGVSISVRTVWEVSRSFAANGREVCMRGMKQVSISVLVIFLYISLPARSVRAETRGTAQGPSSATLGLSVESRFSQISITPRRLAILATPGNGPETFLHVVEAGRPFPPPIARLRHLPDAAVQGAVLPDGAVLVVADYERGRDRSFGSALFRLASQTEPILLCDHVAFASRPLVTSEGRVFVQRGEMGPATEGVMRVDTLSLDEVDPLTGAVRTLWRSKGYIAYLAAAFQNDLVLYHIGPSGARLVLVNREVGTERVVLPSLPPFASDFSVTDAGDLIFQNRDAQQVGSWVVERLHLTSGERDRLQESLTSLAPRAWPHGEVTWNSPGGLRRAGVAPSVNTPKGLVDLRAFASDGMAAASLVFPPGTSAPDVVLLDPSGAELTRIVAPPRTRLEVAGFLP
jgi:hypothetical protein